MSIWKDEEAATKQKGIKEEGMLCAVQRKSVLVRS